MVDDWEQYAEYIRNRGVFNEINIHNFEDLIVRSLKKGAFIEANSLIHNTIEFYLQMKIFNYVLSLYGIDFKDSSIDNKTKFENNEKEIKEKSNILMNRKNSEYLKYLYDYVEICYLLRLIDKSMYKNILKFNSQRNKLVHQLLKKSGTYKFEDLIINARLGRKIQLQLSPIVKEYEIDNILNIFDDYVEKNSEEYKVNKQTK